MQNTKKLKNSLASSRVHRVRRYIDPVKRKAAAERWMAKCLGVETAKVMSTKPLDIGEYE